MASSERQSSPRPVALSVRPENIPDELKAIDRWVLWRYQRPDGKWTKPLFSAQTQRHAKTNDPQTWASFEKALGVYEEGGWDGIGFVLTDEDDLVGVDVDHCSAGDLDDEVRRDLIALDSYGETSPSGQGVRLMVRAKLPPKKRKRAQFEIYESGRYMTMTGHRLDFLPEGVEPRQEQVEDFHARRIAQPKRRVRRRKVSGGSRLQRPTAACRTGSPKLIDGEVLDRARKAKNAEKYRAVYNGDNSYSDGDASAADLSLCSMLAFFTQDEEQIDRLFRGSGRMRDKWDEPHYSSGETYGEHTIQAALDGLSETFGSSSTSPRVVPPPGKWPQVATAFLEQRDRPLLRHQGVFYEWKGALWTELGDDTVRAEIHNWLTGAKYEKDDDLRAWSPNISRVNNVVDSLRSQTHIADVQPPCWIAGEHAEDPRKIIPMSNGLLYVPERRLLPATDEFFNLRAVPYAFDADAPKPVAWLAFLEDVFDHDPSAISAVQEMLGYLLLPVTWLHKIFAIIGPTRSGKGVLLRIVERLLGSDNVTATTFNQLGNQFGQASLIGKSLATLTDARMTSRPGIAALIETLLTISGGDTVSVPRKHRSDWVGRLDVRFFIASNELPYFPDSSKALANRFEIFTTRKSYLGQEDHTLEERLSTEIPGILNWSLEGYDRLMERGRFEGTTSGREMLEEMESGSSPIPDFLEECCEQDPDATVKKLELYRHWKMWAENHGLNPGSHSTFGIRLNAAFPGKFSSKRLRDEDGGRTWAYKGLRLRKNDRRHHRGEEF